MKLCECGCGEAAPIAKQTRPLYGHVKGEPVRFIAGHNNRLREVRPRVCTIDGCSKALKAKSWCSMHYWRWQQHGDPLFQVWTPGVGCLVEDCAAPHSGRGYCYKHLTRLKRHGDLLGRYPREHENIRFWMRVDVSGDCWEWSTGGGDGGYGSFRMDDGITVGAHRFSYQLHKGPIPEGLHILHSCDNPPCVNPDHLRAGTPAENAQDKVAKGRHRLKAAA